MKKSRVKNSFSWMYLIILLVFMYLPIIIMMVYSFNESKILGNWTGFSLKWYEAFLNNSQMLDALKTTIIVALLAAIISTVIGTITVIGLHDYGRFSKSIVTNISYIPVVNPDIITGLSLMMMFMFLKMPLGFGSMLIAHIVFCIPYVIFSVMPKLRQVNFSVYEAAQDLGATPMQALWKVIIPEIMPGIVSGFILSFTLSIDDFAVSFFTTGNGVMNLSTIIYSYAKRGINPSINALSTIMFVVVLVLLIIVNSNNNRAHKKRLANAAAAKNEELAFEMENTVNRTVYNTEERQ